MADKKNLFDFTDVSDLPDDLAKKLAPTNKDDNAKEYADILTAGKDAGLDRMEINQIIAVATRMGKPVPTQQTVRGYLKRAQELELIHMPTRQTYAAGPGEDAEEDDDPLASA